MSDVSYDRDVEDLECRITEGLSIDEACFGADGCSERIRIAWIDEGGRDPSEARQRVGEEVVGAAVERA
jgi:hypothetical protein